MRPHIFRTAAHHRRSAAAILVAASLPLTLLATGGSAAAQPISGANLPNLSVLPARAFGADHQRLKMQVAVWNTKTYDISYVVPMRISLLGSDQRTVVRTRKLEVAPRSVFVKDRRLSEQRREPAPGAARIVPGWGTRQNLNRWNGLALRLSRVPNGVYYVKTQIDPGHVLPEAETGDNVSLRKIQITGAASTRSVAVLPG